MGNDFCNPGHTSKVLSSNGRAIETAILQSRKQMKEQPSVPIIARQKIISLLQINSLDQTYKNSKLWKVTEPYNFCYSNENLNKDSIPVGICSIFLYNNRSEFQGFFQGTVNKVGIRENKGSVYVFPSGDCFLGDKQKPDYGIYLDHSKQYKYEGDWINGKPHGIGKEETKKGVYQGYFLNGKKQGQGKFVFSNGFVYEGEFSNNEIGGEGRLINDQQQYSYVGQFSQGYKQGRGIQKTMQYTYEGNFQKNKKEGNGKLALFEFDIEYEGQFRNNEPNGKGKFKSKDKEFEGIWQNSKLIAVSNYQL